MRFFTKIALLLGLWAATAPIWGQSVGASLSGPVQWGTEADRGRTEVNPKDRTVLLTHRAWVQYSGLDLRAGEIFIDFNNSLLTAYGVRDSSGKMGQYPVFKEGERTLYADTIRYHLGTGKGWIKSANTQEGGGYLHGGQAKMISDSSYFLANNTFSTCNHETPHFAIVTQRAKLDVGKRIVTGPAYLQIAGIPTPLALPFAFFPMAEKRASGFLLPNFSDRREWGLGLTGLGYYFVLNDYQDLRFTADFYSQGSWAVQAASGYRVRYKFNGNFTFNVNRIRFGDPRFAGTGAYQNSTDFRIGWTHNQDPKARPGFRFSAKVDLASGAFFKNATTDPNQFLKNDLSSSISATKTWSGTPFSFSAALRHRQNNQKGTLTLNAPEVNFALMRIQPFRRVDGRGSSWLRDFGIQYGLNARNEWNGLISEIQDPTALLARDRIKAGASHAVSFSTNAKLFKFITLSPSASYNERWYPYRLSYSYDSLQQRVQTDTARGFFAVRDYGAQAALSTTVYGLYKMKWGPLSAVRHVVYPTVSARMAPEFTRPEWGAFQQVQTDSSGTTSFKSRFSGGDFLYGAPSVGGGSGVQFRVRNVLEAKGRKRDTLEPKKFALLEDATVDLGYNPAAGPFAWTLMGARASTSLFKGGLRLVYQGQFDPYGVDSTGKRLLASAWSTNGVLLRPQVQQFSADFRLSGGSVNGRPQVLVGENGLEQDLYANPFGDLLLQPIAATWSLSGGYSLRYDPATPLAPFKQSIRLDASIEPTANWRVGVSSGYDLMARSITFTTLDVYRLIHCWEMRIRWVPMGYARSYSIGLGVRAPLLKDLKLERRRGRGDF